MQNEPSVSESELAASLSCPPAVAALLLQNPWLIEPATILAQNDTIIHTAKPTISRIKDQEPLVLVTLRHREHPKASSAVILGKDGTLNDNCFFATEEELLCRQKPLWPAYHALHRHMRQLQAERLLPHISPAIVRTVIDNPFGFFTAFVLSGDHGYRVETITTRNDNGIDIATITAALTNCSERLTAFRAQISLKATKGRAPLNITGPSARRGKAQLTKKQAASLFESFFHQAMQGKGVLIYLIEQSSPIQTQEKWLLPIVQKAYFEDVQSRIAEIKPQGNATIATLTLENEPSGATPNIAEIKLSSDGSYSFNKPNAAAQGNGPAQTSGTGFDNIHRFAQDYARFLRRPAPHP